MDRGGSHAVDQLVAPDRRGVELRTDEGRVERVGVERDGQRQVAHAERRPDAREARMRIDDDRPKAGGGERTRGSDREHRLSVVHLRGREGHRERRFQRRLERRPNAVEGRIDAAVVHAEGLRGLTVAMTGLP